MTNLFVNQKVNDGVVHGTRLGKHGRQGSADNRHAVVFTGCDVQGEDGVRRPGHQETRDQDNH